MRRIISILIVMSISAAITIGGFPPSVQNSSPNLSSMEKHFRHKLPKSIDPSLLDQAKAASDSLTAEQKKAVLEKIRAHADEVRQRAKKEGRSDSSGDYDPRATFYFSDKHGNRKPWDHERLKKGDHSLLATFAKTKSTGMFHLLARNRRSALRNHAIRAQEADADGDGLPDSFESDLADEFTPEYHVSTGEPDHFARFGDYTPETVIQTFSPYQPISHYRVTPLLISGGLGFLRIDYMTLWDYDSGFDYSDFCLANIALTTGTLGGDIADAIDLVVFLLGFHNLDNERSAMLVAAPVGSDGSYNTDAAAYGIYSIFLSAHEGEPGDRSASYRPIAGPVPPPWHPELTLARSKHATDPFDPYDTSYPDGLPLVPWEIIDVSFFTLYLLYYYGYLNFFEYLFAYYAFSNTFFVCIVEHFGDSGPAFAQTRINVGEVSQPINGSHFIQGDELYNQLTTPIQW